MFGRPIGQNQGVQFPIAEAYIEVEAANLMRFKACALFDAQQPCGAEANMAKYLAAKASWEAANACLQFHGGFGFAHEYDVERKFRETRLYQVAPISTNLILSYVARARARAAALVLMPGRTYLFVPADRPERYEKALAAGAGAVIVDLEDAVAPDAKERARESLARWLSRAEASVLVRVNGGGHAVVRRRPRAVRPRESRRHGAAEGRAARRPRARVRRRGRQAALSARSSRRPGATRCARSRRRRASSA